MPLIKKLKNLLFGHTAKSAALEPATALPRDVFDNLKAALPSHLTYEWDARFNAVLTAFEAGQETEIHQILSSQFDHHWDHVGVRIAPASVQDAIRAFGGLTDGQQLFAISLDDNGTVLLGLWWPWSNGATISIRFVSVALEGTGHSMNTELAEAFALEVH